MHQGESLALKHQVFRFKFTELNEIFWFMSLRSFAVSLVAIFIPVYLYKLGYGLRNILLYYILMYVFEALLEYLSAHLINRVGPKHVIAISVPFWLLHIYQFYSLTTLNWPIWTISLTGGITLSLFWQAYHYDFSKAKKKSETTKVVSSLHIIIAILGALSPFVGGVVASRFGIEYLYLLAILLLGCGIFIILKTSDNHNPKKKLNLKKLDYKCIARDLVSYIGAGWEGSASLMAWPLFVFLVVGTYEGLGFLTSSALILSVFVMFYVGKTADHGGRQKYLKLGDFSTGMIYVFQILATSALHIGIFNTVRNIAHSFSGSTFVSEYYLHADEEGRSEYIFAMETAIDIGRAIYFSTLYFLTFYFQDKIVLIVAILLGGVGILFAALMPPAKCELELDSTNIKVMPRPARRLAKI